MAYDSNCFGIIPEGATHWRSGRHYRPSKAQEGLWSYWSPGNQRWQNAGKMFLTKRDTHAAIRKHDELLMKRKHEADRKYTKSTRVENKERKKKLALILKEAGKSNEEIAAEVGVSQQTLARYFKEEK